MGPFETLRGWGLFRTRQCIKKELSAGPQFFFWQKTENSNPYGFEIIDPQTRMTLMTTSETI